MVVFVVYSHSNLETYLVAFSLLVHYGGRIRRMKIVVVETQENEWMNTTNHDLKPWCGIGTVSDTHISYKETIFHRVLDLIRDGPDFRAFPLGSIRLVQRNGPVWNMDKPFSGQQQIIQVSRGERDRSFGMLYHPIVVVNQLRQLMYHSNKVVFSGIQNSFSIDKLMDQIMKYEKDQQVILLNHQCRIRNMPANHYDYIVGTNIIGVEEVGAQERFRLPSTVLWLPLFKAKTNVASENDIHYRISKQGGNITSIDFNPRLHEVPEEEIISRLDLLRGLKHADISLDAVDYLINTRQLAVHEGRL